MLSESMQSGLNQQITREFYASHLYLAMAADFEAANLKGFAKWMRVQAEEERGHALRIFDFVLERDGRVELGVIDEPPAEFGAPIDVFRQALAHEKKVTAWINELYAQAVKEDDYATQIHLQWFVSEQVEEEANDTEIIERLQLAGDSGAALLMLDAEMGARDA